jgi:predicted kinase
MKPLQLRKPHLIVVVGVPGAGKSFFASKFTTTFHAPYIDHSFYKPLVNSQKACREIIFDTVEKFLLSKQTFVVEGVGNSRADRRELSQLARKRGYDLLFVWVQIDTVVAHHRAVASKQATYSQGEFDAAVRKFDPLERLEKYIVISGKHTHQTQFKMVLKKLVGERPAPARAEEPETKKEKQPTKRNLLFRGRIMG